MGISVAASLSVDKLLDISLVDMDGIQVRARTTRSISLRRYVRPNVRISPHHLELAISEDFG